MNRIRDVLRNEYIGAIAIGMLLAQLIGIAISLIMRPISFYLERATQSRSVFGRTDTELFPWASLIGPAINFVVLALIAFLFLQWLHFRPRPQEASTEAPETEVDDHKSSGAE